MVRTPHPHIKSDIEVRKPYLRLVVRGIWRVLGYAALAATAVALIFDLWAWRFVGDLNFRDAADWWSTLDVASLEGFSRWMKDLSEPVWEVVVNRILRWPAFAMMGGIGMVSMFFGRRRR